jgi:hypothetical protein
MHSLTNSPFPHAAIMALPAFECLASSLYILLVGDVFHPISDRSILPLLNCNMGHSGWIFLIGASKSGSICGA